MSAGRPTGVISIFHQKPRNTGEQRYRGGCRTEGAEGERRRKGRTALERAGRVLYKTARDITSNIRKTDSPAAASSRRERIRLPPLTFPPPRDPSQPSTVRYGGNEVVSILASGRTPRPVVQVHQLLPCKCPSERERLIGGGQERVDETLVDPSASTCTNLSRIFPWIVEITARRE